MFSLKTLRQPVAGFSLLELAVVLVIVALVAGGVLAGREMLHQSKLREVAQQAVEYGDVISQFQQKYGELPGDFSGATRIWGRADGNTANLRANCAQPASNQNANLTLTCNGDGNGKIGLGGSEYEVTRLWQHLRNAELVTGRYTGAVGPANSQYSAIGVNVPKGPFAAAGYNVLYHRDGDALNGRFAGTYYRHAVYYGSDDPSSNYTFGQTLSAKDSYYVDRKFDNGTPGTGNITSFNNTTHATCATSDDPAIAIYDRQNDNSEDCALIFQTGY